MIDRARVTGIVLAGGRSSRFGSPKLEVEIEGATILARAIRAVAQISGEVILAGPPPPARSTLDQAIRVFADEQPFAGPLAALVGALGATTTEFAIVVGGDMPALVPAVLGSMLGRCASNAGVDAVLLSTGADALPRQVLPLALRVGPGLAAAVDGLSFGDRSLSRLIDRLRFEEIPDWDWRILDPTGQTVLDVDVPDDIARLQGQKIR